MKVTALAGGVGGAKLANGLANCLKTDELMVVVNTGDDFIYSGLYICPDLDTVTYTLAGINDPVNGWGIKDDSKLVLSALQKLDHPIWFSLGDQDIATHLERTRLLSLGFSLTQVSRILAEKLNVRHTVIPMTDSSVKTMLDTEEYGLIAFQEYFVKHHFQPVIKQIFFDGAKEARLTSILQDFLFASDLILICPSNPFVSIDPILSIPGIKDIIARKCTIAVSPLIGGKAVKGPAAKLMIEMGMQPSALSVANYYREYIKGFVLDRTDHTESNLIRQCGIIPLETEILMPEISAQTRLAKEILDFGIYLLSEDH